MVKMTPSPREIQAVRKGLSAEGLYALLRRGFREIADHQQEGSPTALVDALMSAVAMFSLKDPSLLAFDGRRNDDNLKNLFGIQHVFCDTHMREILDPLDPESLRPLFGDVFRELQRGKVLERFVFYHGSYLLLLDGTGYFSSKNIHCDACLQKVNKKTGEVTYQHQMVGAVIAHPNHKEVIPLAPEPIQKQDGNNKNDCERNATKRLLVKIRKEHPRLPLIVVEDGLASNAPHIRELNALGMSYILGVKPGDHAFLFDQVVTAFEEDRVTTVSWYRDDVLCEISFINGLPLNESNQDLIVNFLRYAEYTAEGDEHKLFTWITDLRITRGCAEWFVRGGRSRWKIENETFNTLKNQDYQYEHNYGHGYQHLAVVFAQLMMLTFLIDQVQQICCPLFRAVWSKLRTKRALWDNLRSHFRHFIFESMKHLYEVMLSGSGKVAAPVFDTS
jgi:hypothetical protein